jgi:hypothetical protein
VSRFHDTKFAITEKHDETCLNRVKDLPSHEVSADNSSAVARNNPGRVDGNEDELLHLGDSRAAPGLYDAVARGE